MRGESVLGENNTARGSAQNLVIALTVKVSRLPQEDVVVGFFLNCLGRQEGGWSFTHGQEHISRGRKVEDGFVSTVTPTKNGRAVPDLHPWDYAETGGENGCGKESKQKTSWLLTWMRRIHLNQHLPTWFLERLPSFVWDTGVNELNWKNSFPYSENKHSTDIWLENVPWHSTRCFVGHCDSLNALNKSINWLFNCNWDRSKI